ncbi:MAG: DUF2007 domain-containing protein [Bacteroidetes bacterium]|nr:DUF2007 domain-containing protein [Bacteroidota bacterium]
MEDKLALIYTSHQLYEIELIRGMLLENDIESFIVNKQDSSYLIGDIELYVSIDAIMKAKQLILKFDQSE